MKFSSLHLAAALLLPAWLAGCGGGNDASDPAPAAQAALSVTQTVDSASVFAGDRVTWTVTVTNAGNAASSDTTTLLIDVPSSLSAVSVVSSGASCGPSVSTLTCTIGAGLPPGKTATVLLSATTTATGSLTSTVKPSGAGVKGCSSAADCSSTTVVSTRPVPPNVTVSAAVDATSTSVGGTVKWTLTAVNTGGVTTAPITLTDTLPAAGIGAVTVTPTGANCGAVVGNTLSCTIPAGLAANTGTATVVIAAPATAAGNLVNTVAPGTGASCASTASCTTTTAVAAAAAADVKVGAAVNLASASIGDKVQWTVTATNQGTGATTAPVTLTTVLPASGVGAFTVTPTGATCSPITGATLNCSIPAGLAASGGKATVLISANTTAAGALTSTVTPGAGASCTSGAACTTSTTVLGGAAQIAGSCGVMIDAATLNASFGGASGTLVDLAALGNTATGSNNTSAYLAGLSATGTTATFESWPGAVNGPGFGTMVAASGQQFICASQNDSGATGASSAVKYSSTVASGSSLAANIQISKAGTNAGFVMFNLRSLSQFSFEYFRAGSNGYQLDYSTDGSTWRNIVTTSPSRAACAGNVCTESNVMTTQPASTTSFTATAPIIQPVLLRLSNTNTSGTMVIQKLMIKP